MLRDLASYVWPNSVEEYPPLKDAKGNPMNVKPDRYVNRLVAYLHIHKVSESAREYIESELGRLTSSLHELNDLDSAAHTQVDKQQATLAVLGTYLLLAEIVRRTNLKPIDPTFSISNA